VNYDDVLLTGLALDIADQGLAVWRDDTPYLPSERGITLHRLPEDPPEVVAINPYMETEIATYRRDQETVVSFLQVRLRVHDPAEGLALQGALRDRYHRRRVTFTVGADSVTVTGRQQSRGPLGDDQNGRYLFTQNFSFTGLRART